MTLSDRPTRDTTLDIVAAMLAEAEHDRLSKRAAAEYAASKQLRIVWYLATQLQIVDEAIEYVQTRITPDMLRDDPDRGVSRVIRAFYAAWLDAIIVAAASAGRVGGSDDDA